MTAKEALLNLANAARMKHVVSWEMIGPSHGDPGGYRVIKREGTCAAVEFEWATIKAIHKERCNCVAKEHNERVDMWATKILQQL